MTERRFFHRFCAGLAIIAATTGCHSGPVEPRPEATAAPAPTTTAEMMKDSGRAAEYYKRACDGGVTDGCTLLAKLKREGPR